MDPARWKQIEAIFEQALEQPTGERDAFVTKACAGDEQLLAEVRSLLAADTAGHSLLDGNAIDALDSMDAFTMKGRTIGPYRVVDELGVGGMGAVYLAERADGQFQQRVALKVIKRGLDTEAVLTRFHAERQILARLQHPNIARLLDGGVTDDGLPFFTLEHVEGTPIDEYCDSRHLNIDERLELFMQACEAVRYAQQNLVVHRDLKPSNILVTGDGKVKLLDFGIAKLVDDEEAGTGLTRTGHRVMTPGYASPEQVRGEAVTTATDVYSLGVILYELLTGQRPYPEQAKTPGEIERAIVDTTPERPSTRVTRPTQSGDTAPPDELSRKRSSHPRQLRNRLRGDLDNICLKALRKEPERRYHSAEQLLEDLVRHRSGRPVSARPDTAGYRFTKFVQRNAAGVVAATAAFLVIVTLITVYTVKLSRERDRAKLEASKAASVSDFLISLFEVADPNESRGEEVTARELLDRGAVRIRDELADQPEVQAKMMTVVGRVYHSLGLYAKADTLLRQSLAMRKAMYGDEHPEVMETLGFLSWVAYNGGDVKEAARLSREVLRQRRKFLGDRDGQVALSLNDIGWMEYEQGNLDDAIELHKEALDIRREVYGNVSQEVAESLNNLAIALAARGSLDEAIAMNQEVLDIRRQLLGDHHPEVGYTLMNLAVFYEQQGRYEEAEKNYRQALEIQEVALGKDHPENSAVYVNLARTIRYQGRYDEAEPLVRRALELDLKRGDEHPYVAYDIKELGDLYHEKGDNEAALAQYREALRIYRVSFDDTHGYILSTNVALAAALHASGRSAEAESLIRDALKLLRERLEPDHVRIGSAESLLGAVCLSLGRVEEAGPLLEDGYRIIRQNLGDDDRRTHKALERLDEYRQRVSKP